MSVQRILINQAATLTATFYAGETAADPGGTTATVTVYRGDGTVLVGPVSAVHAGTGTFTYTLAAQAQLNNLTAVWTGTDGSQRTTYHEIVGGFFAELADIRALEGLSNTTKYPTALLESARVQAEQRFEWSTWVSWVPRYARDILDGNNRSDIVLTRQRPRTVLSVTTDGTVQTDLTQFRLYTYGVLERTNGVWFLADVYGGGQNVIVEYTHGYDRPPEDLRWAFLTYVRYLLYETQSRIPDRASAFTTPDGTFQLVTAGFQRPTGLPDVDAILNARSHRIPGVSSVTAAPGRPGLGRIY